MTDSEDHLARSVDKLNVTIDQLRHDLVRKDVYDAQRAADRDRVEEVRHDINDLQEWRKWLSRGVFAALVISIVPSLVMLYITQQVVGGG